MSKKLRTNTVDFGIDLGTTTSIIARVDGNDAPIIPNFTSNTNFTPSAVAIDKRGTMLVGEKAKRQALSDPKNAFSGAATKQATALSALSDSDDMDSDEAAKPGKIKKLSVSHRLDRFVGGADPVGVVD